MKKTFVILALVSLLSCKAQTRLILIQNQTPGSVESYDYLIDADGLLDPFVGKWVYTNGTTILKFDLRKAVNNNNGYYREDLIYGEYRYVENGVEKINTLSEIDNIYQAQANHNIDGNNILSKGNRPVCNDCNEDEKRLQLSIGDPVLDVAGIVYLRRITIGGVPALSVLIHFDGIRTTGNTTDGFNKEFVGSTIPNGEYILIKEP